MSRASSAPWAIGRIRSSSPWMTRTGSGSARRALDPLPRAEPGANLAREQGLGGRVETPAHGVLDLLRRVRLREALREEEREKPFEIAEPEVPVVLRPALVRLELLVETIQDRAVAVEAAEREGRADEDCAGDPFRMRGREEERALRAERERDDDRPLGSGGVEDGKGVGRELVFVVGVRVGRAVRAPVPARVECDRPRVPREVGELELPVARVDDRPGRQEEQGGLALAVDLVVDADTASLDVALRVRVAGAGLLGPLAGHDRHFSASVSQPSIQSRSSRWPLSMPESRSRMIPSLKVITSVTSASSGIGMP